MAHSGFAAAPSICSSLAFTRPNLHHQRKSFRLPLSLPHSTAFSLPSAAAPFSMIENHSRQRIKRETRHYRIAALPMFSLAVAHEFIRERHDFSLDEPTLKNIYLVFNIFFCWGCCVFASMKDPFYESDYYRKAGGDGTQNWMYNLEEKEEVSAREELLREELVRELEEKVVGLKELEDAEKEKELV